MNFRPLVGLVALTLLFGCKSKESQIPGSWSSGAQGGTILIKPDKTWSLTTGNVEFKGSWSFDGTDVTLTPLTAGNIPIAQAKRSLQAFKDRQGPNSALTQEMVDDVDKPNVMKLSDDGTLMTTDRLRDKNSEGQTFKKIESPQ